MKHVHLATDYDKLPKKVRAVLQNTMFLGTVRPSDPVRVPYINQQSLIGRIIAADAMFATGSNSEVHTNDMAKLAMKILRGD